MPDFDTRRPPEPSRRSNLPASGAGASRRPITTAAGLLRSINRHRWATGLAVIFVMILAIGSAAYWLKFVPKAPAALEQGAGQDQGSSDQHERQKLPA
jgi:hypothetical protein